MLDTTLLLRRRALLRRSEGEGVRLPRIGPACRDHRLCVALCPERALVGFELDGRRGVALHVEACTGCGRCAEQCPEQAIRLVPRGEAGEGLQPLTAHEPAICEHCLEPFVGGPGEAVCAACNKDLSLFRTGGRSSAAVRPGSEEGERT